METKTLIIDGKEVEVNIHAVEKAKKLFGAVEKE